MMTSPRGIFLRFLPVLMISILATACGNRDADIQTAITEKAETTPELAGIHASVDNGMVIISGEFKDEASKTTAEEAVKSIKGVKSVVDNASIAPPSPPPAPVVVNPDDQLSRSVADAAKAFPGVSTSVTDGVVTLTGNIKRRELPRLMKALNSLKPGKIENKLTVK
jgi:osmotically-inducible protein OsmY